MLKKLKGNYKVQLFGISVLAFILVSLGWGYIIQEANNYKEGIIDSFGVNQEILVSEISKNVKNSLATNSSQAREYRENLAVNIISKAETSGSRYWFLYSSDGLIFEKNKEETRTLEGKTTSELVKYWKLNGGSGMETLEEMINQGQSGSTLFTKNVGYGPEIVSIKNFNSNDTEYFLGMSTKEEYIMSTSRVTEHILYMYTFCALISLNILILVLFICKYIYKSQKKIKKLNKSLIDKSMKIQELATKLSSKSEAVENASIYDSLTKLYNRKFFDSLLSRIKHDLLLPVSIVILDINGLGQLNNTGGYSSGDELLGKTSEILNRVFIDTDVVARTGSSEFTILMTGTKEQEAYGAVENIRRLFDSLDNNSELTVSFGVAQMRANESDILTVLEDARKNLILDKMLDKNSSSNNIISMLMEALKAYSEETVDHSERLKNMAIKFGKDICMSPSEISRLAVAAQLHDVGKIGIPDSILNKKEALTQNEKELIRRHSELGFKIVNAIPVLDEVAIDILQHHEHYDGKGYPDGLSGKAISINARIINIIDSFDAMTNASIYSKVKTKEEAMDEIMNKSFHQYDPDLVNEFVKLMGMELVEKELILKREA